MTEFENTIQKQATAIINNMSGAPEHIFYANTTIDTKVKPYWVISFLGTTNSGIPLATGENEQTITMQVDIVVKANSGTTETNDFIALLRKEFRRGRVLANDGKTPIEFDLSNGVVSNSLTTFVLGEDENKGYRTVVRIPIRFFTKKVLTSGSKPAIKTL